MLGQDGGIVRNRCLILCYRDWLDLSDVVDDILLRCRKGVFARETLLHPFLDRRAIITTGGRLTSAGRYRSPLQRTPWLAKSDRHLEI